jgi:tight adherence protein C
MILYLVPLLTALTLLTAAAALYQYRFRSRRVVERLRNVVGEGEFDEPVDLGPHQTSVHAWLRPVAFLGWLLPGMVYSETLRWEMARAGFRHAEARGVYAGARVLCAVALGLGGFAVGSAFSLAPIEATALALAAALAGFYIPAVVLRARQAKRQMEITLALPDALDLLVICVEAGQGLNAAMIKVGRECRFQSQALSEELHATNNEMVAGVTRAQALRNLAMRTGVDDVRALVAVMIQSDRFGTSIARALRVHAQSLRTRRRQRAEENARKTPVKLVFPLVFCIFPELLVIILAPGMLELYRALSDVARG